MKKILALFLALCLIVSLLAACGKSSDDSSSSESSDDAAGTAKAEDVEDPVDTIKAVASTDKYRSFYQIWIGSFYDSDGDGIGDLKGVTEKLDYINDGDPNSGDDLGADAIWLSPMMPSSTYHKYNVEDYFNIDPEFGTLSDFDALIEECHKRGVTVIIDLVLNHAGAGHEYFKKACEELADGKEDGYARYFNFSKKKDFVYQYAVPDSDYYYQADFWDQMPDWNLSFEGTRNYFDEVTKFWTDRGVDGFRLDAVAYFEDSHTDGEEFMKWFYDMAKGYNPDVYAVGEYWSDMESGVYKMYATGIDSMFNFKFANNDGVFMTASHGDVAEMCTKLEKYENKIKENNPNGINANFLTNHDMVRAFNNLDEDDYKMAAALYMLAPGNTFTYCGEEIALESEGSDDEYKRTAMIWDSDDIPDITVNGKARAVDSELGGVKQELEQEHSLLNTYRKLIKIRLQNPEIARGDITQVLDLGDDKCGGFIIDYNGSRVVVIHNNTGEAKEITVDMIDSPELRGWSAADLAESPCEDVPVLDGDVLAIPARTSVVLKENK